MQRMIGQTMTILALAGGMALAADRLPEKALPLSKVLALVEQAGISSIVEAGFEDGVWEVEGFRGEQAVELHLDPLTGKVIHEDPERIVSKPGPNAKTALAIVKLLEEQGYAPVLEIEWERDHWEAEAMHAQLRKKLHLAGDTGKIVSERRDD